MKKNNNLSASLERRSPERSSTKDWSRLSRKTIETLWNTFSDFRKKGKIESFEVTTKKKNRSFVKIIKIVMLAREITFQFHSVAYRIGVDHEKSSSRNVIIRVGRRTNLETLFKTIADDVQVKYVGFAIEESVANAFSPENRPRWCVRFRKASDSEDMHQSFDFVFGIKGHYRKGVMKANVKRTPHNPLNSHDAHKQKAFQIPIIEIPYPCTMEVVHQKILEAAKEHLPSRLRIEKRLRFPQKIFSRKIA